MIEARTKTELEELVKTKAIVKIGTSCCGPCGLVEKNLESIEASYPNIIFVKIDAEECDEELLDKLNIRNVPTILLYDNGEVINKVCGVQTVDQLKEFLV